MYYYTIYDYNGRYVGFCETLEDAIEMSTEYEGHYELEYSPSDSIFG